MGKRPKVSRRREGYFALAAVLCAIAWPSAVAGAGERSVLRGSVAAPQEQARAGRGLTGTCREIVLRELAEGRRSDDACDDERRRAGRLALRPGIAFGYIASREVDLRGVHLVVGRAELCRRWPLRATGGSVLRAADVEAAHCRQRRTSAPITVTVVRVDGVRVEDVAVLRPDPDGRVELSYGALDLRLRTTGLGTLDDYVRVELGAAAWAGVVDLRRLREFRAAWHYRWVSHGRGAPGLFAALYGEHPGAADAHALSIAAAVERQRRALPALQAGTASPSLFLQRFPSTPFRARMEGLQRFTHPAGRSAPDESSESPAERDLQQGED